MKRFFAIGLLLSCALIASDLPAQSGPGEHTTYQAGSPPDEQVTINSSVSTTSGLYAVSTTSVDNADVDLHKPVADTTDTRKPEGQSSNTYKPAQDDHPLQARGTVAHQPKHELPALPERLPALHLSQAWHIPHRPGQLHRITHY